MFRNILYTYILSLGEYQAGKDQRGGRIMYSVWEISTNRYKNKDTIFEQKYVFLP